MTHLKSNKSQKRFVCKVVDKAKGKKMYKIYRAVEKAIGYKHKKSKKRYSRR